MENLLSVMIILVYSMLNTLNKFLNISSKEIKTFKNSNPKLLFLL